ncbi:MAG TPA: hypothetical protein GX503_06250, partial [Clostridiales bacterium]|nr:hypothetical protein [Clostridiales bacterium]
SEKIDIRAGGAQDVEPFTTPKIINFFLPILVLIGSTIAWGLDMQAGVLITLAFIFVFYVFQGLDPEAFVDEMLRGLKNMLMPIVMVVLAFSFAAACEEIMFIDYVVDVAKRFMTPQMLPFVVFLVFGTTEFIMGISWGMYIIALPIVLPVTYAVGGDPIMTVGAVAAAGVWGSHCCFYSDATILTSASTGCDNFRHAITQIPFGLIAGIIAGIGYLILGFTAF